MLNSRSLLHRTASAIGWWTSTDRSPGEAAPLPLTLETTAESAVAGGYSAGIALGFCLPIRSPVCAGFGHANLETDTQVGAQTVFRAGQCGRQIVAAATLLLAERNELRIDDRIDLFLPGEPGADQLCLGDLLVADDASYALLMRIIEQVTGDRFPVFVSEALLQPAGMTASGFRDPGDVIPNRAAGYRLADERAHDFANAASVPGASRTTELFTTPGDLMLWNRALYCGRLLSRGTVERMVTPTAQGSPCPVLAPFLDRHGRGFGLEIGRLFGRRAFWQRGRAPGFDAWLFHFPDDRADLALLANTEQGAATILEPMLRALLRV